MQQQPYTFSNYWWKLILVGFALFMFSIKSWQLAGKLNPDFIIRGLIENKEMLQLKENWTNISGNCGDENCKNDITVNRILTAEEIKWISSKRDQKNENLRQITKDLGFPEARSYVYLAAPVSASEGDDVFQEYLIDDLLKMQIPSLSLTIKLNQDQDLQKTFAKPLALFSKNIFAINYMKILDNESVYLRGEVQAIAFIIFILAVLVLGFDESKIVYTMILYFASYAIVLYLASYLQPTASSSLSEILLANVAVILSLATAIFLGWFAVVLTSIGFRYRLPSKSLLFAFGSIVVITILILNFTAINSHLREIIMGFNALAYLGGFAIISANFIRSTTRQDFVREIGKSRAFVVFFMAFLSLGLLATISVYFFISSLLGDTRSLLNPMVSVANTILLVAIGIRLKPLSERIGSNLKI